MQFDKICRWILFSKEKVMIIKIATSALAVFIAIIAHEIAHGFVAKRLGDNTAQNAGRLSLNPLKHIDIFGTILLPILLFLAKTGFIFGWAKPVPIDYSKLKYSKLGVVMVASAGVLMNFLLALVSAILLKLSLLIPFPALSGILAMFWLQMIFFNIVLAVFNLLPIPPLDGSKILLGWSDNPYIERFLNSERSGLIFIIIIAFVVPALLQTFGIHFNPFAAYLRQTSILLAGWLI